MALPADVIAELREHETFEQRFREGLELGEGSGKLARALEVAAFAMLRASRALRAAAAPPSTSQPKGATPC